MKNNEDNDGKLKHNSFGKIQISRVDTNGFNIFGDTSGNKNNKLINLSFNTAEITNSLKEQRFMSKSNVMDIYLTTSQWTNLLTTINNSNGIPCTISTREDLGRLHFNNDDKDNLYENNVNKIKTIFEDDFKKIFPDMEKKVKKLKEQIKQDNIETFERKQILNDIQTLIENFYNNKEKVLEILEKNINKLDSVSSLELANQIKSNFFNFNLPKDIEEAKRILLNSSKDLGFNLLTDNKKEEILPKNDYEGVIVLKEIESNNFVNDNECKNGYSLEIFEAKKTKIDNVIVITPDKKLLEYNLSVNQFSDLMTSFNRGDGIVSTIKETIKIKNIEPYTGNKNDDFDFKLKSFEELFSGRNEQLDTINDKFSNNLKTKNISKNKQREMEIDLDTMFYRSYSDVLYFFNKIVDSRNKTILNKLTDVLNSLNRGIKNLGLKQFINDLKNNDKSFLVNMMKKHSGEILLEKPKKNIDNNKTLEL